ATLFLLNTNLYANEQIEATQSVDKVQEAVLYLNTYKDNSLKTADNFGHLVVQTAGGRMQPLATLNRQIVRKLSGRSTFLGMNSDQIILGMLSRPDFWKDVKILKINTPKLKKLLNIPIEEKYISFSEVFNQKGEYIIAKEAEAALLTKPIERGTFEKDII